MTQAPVRFLIAAAVLAAVLAQARAQTADPHHPGGPASASQAGMMEIMRPMMTGRGGMAMPSEYVEGRIAYLRAELKITDASTASTAPWNAFADAMRADAAAMKAVHEGMAKDGMPGSLPERLATQQKTMSAHMGMLERMEAGAEPLYAALSGEQRTLLDQMMASPIGMM